eukprot:450674-Rhodomonas_salina.3
MLLRYTPSLALGYGTSLVQYCAMFSTAVGHSAFCCMPCPVLREVTCCLAQVRFRDVVSFPHRETRHSQPHSGHVPGHVTGHGTGQVSSTPRSTTASHNFSTVSPGNAAWGVVLSLECCRSTRCAVLSQCCGWGAARRLVPVHSTSWSG